MCGIFCYAGNKEAIPFIINGLKRLEYRGYDSWGLCLVNNNTFEMQKSRGKISEALSETDLDSFMGKIGIGHTRWATHGEPSEINAHPHLDCKNEIAVVHNGIIENYQALKELLELNGHKFRSETDTEVIAHLIEKFGHLAFETAVMKAVSLLEGAFGIAVIHKREKKIITARKGSPLVLGVGRGEMFAASDAASVLNYTKKVVYLDDNEMAVITPSGFLVKSFNGEQKSKDIQNLKLNIDEIEKHGFKHFMLKEIFEQPKATANTLRGRINNGKVKLSLGIKPKEIKRIIILACGTSFYSALVGKYVIEKLNKIPVEVDYASEFRYRTPIVKKGDLVIVISQSGETADTLGALRLAKSKGAATLGIINVVGSTIAREVDSGIFLHAGPEIGVASTKAFTCQLTALALFAFFLQQERGAEVNQKLLSQLNQTPTVIEKALKKADSIKAIAQALKNNSNFLYLGRGFNFPVALEGALKLKEISYIHAEGYPAAEMKHGPIALIDEKMPVVFIATKNETYNKVLNNIEEVKARKGIVLAVTNEHDKRVSMLADYIIEVPQTTDIISPIINVLPLQLLAYYIADLKGLDVDKPRNLAKSVTCE